MPTHEGHSSYAGRHGGESVVLGAKKQRSDAPMSLNDGQASGTFARLMLSMCRCRTDKTLFTFVRAGLISFLPFTDCGLLKLQSGQQAGRRAKSACLSKVLLARRLEGTTNRNSFPRIPYFIFYISDLEKCTFSPLFTVWAEASCQNIRVVRCCKGTFS